MHIHPNKLGLLYAEHCVHVNLMHFCNCLIFTAELAYFLFLAA